MNFIKPKVRPKPAHPKKESKETMRSLIKELRDKKEEIMRHPGIKKIENVRILNLLKESFIARTHPEEFLRGSAFIKKILIYKLENPLLFTVGKQASLILNKLPELKKPEIIKSILIASANPKLKIEDINKLVIDMFSEKDEKKRDKNILSFIRNINKKNYGYLLD